MSDDTKLEIDGLQEGLKKLAARTVGDADRDVFSAKASYAPSLEVSGMTLSIDAGAGASVSCFNTADDEDPDRICGTAEAKKDGKPGPENELEPQIPFSPKDAWLKLQASCKVTGTTGAGRGSRRLGVDASKEVLLSDYRKHGRGAKLGEAVLADVASFRMALHPADIKTLAAGDALAYQARGRFQASVALSWSDIFTGNLAGLMGLGGRGSLVAIKVGVEASVSFRVELTDDFLLVFTWAEKDRVRVAVRKAKARESTIDAALGVVAKLADEKVVEEVLDDVVEGLVGVPFAKVDALLAKADPADLSTAETKLLDYLLDAFDLEGVKDELDAVRKRWEKLRKDVAAAIEAVAKAKVELSFKYEYLRVRTESTLLQATMSMSSLASHHGQLLNGDLASITSWLRSPGDGRVERYLHQTTRTEKRSYGLSVSLGKVSSGGKDTDEAIYVRQENIHRGVRLAYGRMRGYEGTLGKDKVRWVADFRASMETFSAPEANPTGLEFEVGCALSFRWEERKLKDSELPAYIDAARCWGAAGGDDMAAAALVSPLANKPAVVRVDIDLPPAVFERLVPLLGEAADAAWGSALGAAMPRWRLFPFTSERRRELYGPLWTGYLASPRRSLASLAGLARKVLEDAGEGDLARIEGDWPDVGDNPFTFVGQVRLNSERAGGTYTGTAERWASGRAGFRVLASALGGRPHELIGTSFRQIRELCTQALHVRALGILLLDLASPDATIQRTATFEPETGKAFVLGRRTR